MAKVKAIAVGYYKHRLVQPGEIFNKKGVDEKGFYIDASGKRKVFSKYGPDGKEVGKEERKCKWVDHISTEADKPIDPKEVAEVISGKRTGIDTDSDDEAEESFEKPAKGR